ADREMNDAGMPAEHLAVEIDDIAGFRRTRLQAFDNVRIVAGRNEADVLAVMLVGNCKTEAARKLSCLRLAAFAKRETQYLELFPGRTKQEITLIALFFACAIERSPAAGQGARSDVVAGRQNIGTEFARGDQQIMKFDGHVAVDTWHRRLAVNITFGEAVDDGLLEAALIVEHVMWNADALGNAARVI